MTSNNDKRMESLSQMMSEGLAKKVEKALLEVLEMAICQNFKESRIETLYLEATSTTLRQKDK
ncbi:11362_t:CDS:2 [Funneliformis geosporum]|nr:11362_t:CDS:2 [Funneliformis geosporum]